MMAIRKFGWSVLVLAAFTGCGKQEPEPAKSLPTDTTTVPGTPAPETPPAAAPAPDTKPEPDKGATSSPEMPKEAPAIEAPQPTPATKDEKKSADKAAAATLTNKQLADIKKLPKGEAEDAIKQVVCPVSGKNLGSMGMPFKVAASGRTFYLCCEGCEEDVKDDPAAVIAKLKR